MPASAATCEDLNADAREGHLSAGISHLGNISYYLGEKNKVSPNEAADALAGVKSLDDNNQTLERTLQHLRDKICLIGTLPDLAGDPPLPVFIRLAFGG